MTRVIFTCLYLVYSCSTLQVGNNYVDTSEPECNILPFDFDIGEQDQDPYKQALQNYEQSPSLDLKILHFHIVPGHQKESFASVLLKSENGVQLTFFESGSVARKISESTDSLPNACQENDLTGSYLSDCLISGQSHKSSDIFVVNCGNGEWKINYTGLLPEGNSKIDVPTDLLSYILALEQKVIRTQ